ncbi:hypothetical protein IQ07DRAFT_318588 [Pyrenochaeta sp. DS3sAY3a]|nr:hypothetical protein IQ07DRAFT_318588 [Pyrenochaeta sp. DS3sAY3a]
MADHAKILKAVKEKKAAIAEQERLGAEWSEQLQMLLEMDDPGALAEFRTEMDSSIATHAASAKRLREELAALETQLPKSPEPEPVVPKFDPEKHPLLRKAAVEEPEKAIVFATGDMVEAQWSDKSWYKAKIQSVLGSASAPKYLVRFVDYDDTMTIDYSAVRPIQSKRKRDADSGAANPSIASAASSSHIISGAPTVNLVQTAKTEAITQGEPKKPSRVPTKGTLKKRASAWQDFQSSKTSKKMPKKESMFRTSTDVGSRVGFTGSGRPMTETHKRTRYDKNAEVGNAGESGHSASYDPRPEGRRSPYGSPPHKRY